MLYLVAPKDEFDTFDYDKEFGHYYNETTEWRMFKTYSKAMDYVNNSLLNNNTSANSFVVVPMDTDNMTTSTRHYDVNDY